MENNKKIPVRPTGALGGDMIEYYGGPVQSVCRGGLRECLKGLFCAPCLLSWSFSVAGYGSHGLSSLHSWCACCKVATFYFSCLCDSYFATGMQEINENFGGRKGLESEFRTQLWMCPCCTACQMDRAVREASRSGERTTLNPGPVMPKNVIRGKIPPGKMANEEFSVTLTDGTVLNLIVPRGLKGGDEFKIPYKEGVKIQQPGGEAAAAATTTTPADGGGMKR